MIIALPERYWSPCSPLHFGVSLCSPWSCVCVVCTGDRPWKDKIVSHDGCFLRFGFPLLNQVLSSRATIPLWHRYSHGTTGERHGVGVGAAAGANASPFRIDPRIGHIGGVGACSVYITVGTNFMQNVSVSVLVSVWVEDIECPCNLAPK